MIFKPEVGERWFSLNLNKGRKEKYRLETWKGSGRDHWFLEQGLVFKTKEEAIEAADKILSILPIIGRDKQ